MTRAMDGAAIEARLHEALALHRGGQVEAAAAIYREVLAQAPSFDALHLLGVAEHQLGRLDAAGRLFEQALALRPTDPHALNNAGNLWRDRRDAATALAHYERALQAAPGHVEALNNAGLVLLELQRPAEALARFELAVLRAPIHAPSHHHRGRALLALAQRAPALQAFERALQCDGTPAAAWVDAATVLEELGRADEALAAWEQAVARAPRLPFVFGQWLHARLRLCVWDGLDAAVTTLAAGIDAGRPVAPPFVTLCLPLSAARQRHAARIYARDALPAPRPRAPVAARRDARIRLGYVSGDFRAHPLSQLIGGLLAAHDRAGFEVVAFSHGPPSDDPLRARIVAAVDRFVDLRGQDDAAIAAAVRGQGIDIAIDLGGATRGARPGVFAHRAAPLQLAWIGYPGPSGAPWIDYLVADRIVLPADGGADIDGERVLRLPPCALPCDGTLVFDAPVPGRTALGLPEDGLVFCCFNGFAKIEPEAFGAWLRLLVSLPSAVLWLLDGPASAIARLRDAARAQGIDSQRLVFAPRVPLQQHLARLRAADIALDTFFYNGHTTTADALLAGVPVVTRRGATFPGRVAASLLEALGLTQLVAGTTPQYESIVLRLAADAAERAALRGQLARARHGSRAFDPVRQARGFEAGCRAAWRRHLAGLLPVDIEVRDDDAAGPPRVVEADLSPRLPARSR